MFTHKLNLQSRYNNKLNHLSNLRIDQSLIKRYKNKPRFTLTQIHQLKLQSSLWCDLAASAPDIEVPANILEQVEKLRRDVVTHVTEIWEEDVKEPEVKTVKDFAKFLKNIIGSCKEARYTALDMGYPEEECSKWEDLIEEFLENSFGFLLDVLQHTYETRQSLEGILTPERSILDKPNWAKAQLILKENTKWAAAMATTTIIAMKGWQAIYSDVDFEKYKASWGEQWTTILLVIILITHHFKQLGVANHNIGFGKRHIDKTSQIRKQYKQSEARLMKIFAGFEELSAEQQRELILTAREAYDQYEKFKKTGKVPITKELEAILQKLETSPSLT